MEQERQTIDVTVRSVPADLWRRLKAEAALRGEPIPTVLAEALQAHLEKENPQ